MPDLIRLDPYVGFFDRNGPNGQEHPGLKDVRQVVARLQQAERPRDPSAAIQSTFASNIPEVALKTPLKLFVGLGIPYAAVVGALPWVASTDYPIFGVPFIYAWIFGCFILTSACLYACWFFFDRHLETVD